MTPVTLEVFVLIFVGGGLLTYLIAWYWSDKKDHQEYSKLALKSVYYCVKCGNIYSQNSNESFLKCPKCCFKNSRLNYETRKTDRS